MDGSEIWKLSADIARAAAQAAPRARLVVAKTARDIEADAKQLAPVDTGNLQGSIGSDINGLEATIGPTASYGIYLELGTTRMAAQPFMGPAADRRQGPFGDAMARLGEGLLGG
ncbi:hypothetical protein ASF21_12880 [Arthrobacter sp. Leaf234]|uniref:HK97-gp10 family putative phage morphogenesis protein n=1 Tax=Arthrobacter sp. Leaf234 TaxID=1736303 RepID=UPI0006FB1071|nr:HK97-gp10 family putative phage morphogenesis protein [Arthrobacter sp. Leaf234]KQN99696.1 hypothetical protein ASF21_12880 [Arthrobacter sp. Leaf234]